MEGIITLLVIFAIPVIFTSIDFVFYITTGEKRFDHFGGLILEFVHLIGFPTLFAMFFHYAGGRAMSVFQEPFTYITLSIIILSVIAYFIVRYAYLFINNTFTTVLLFLLACGIFINISMISDEPTILSAFNLAIIILYIMQIGSHIKRLVLE